MAQMQTNSTSAASLFAFSREAFRSFRTTGAVAPGRRDLPPARVRHLRAPVEDEC